MTTHPAASDLTSPPCLEITLSRSPLEGTYRTQGVLEHYRTIGNNLDESKTIS